ncbi:MAG: DNA-processing protein DprA [Deltaproteobacteria bacterium]|nr:DNA-processing protein DprA [Deltaproteobacteria bacterium]
MPIWSDKRCGWLALQMIPGLGNIACKNLLNKFGDPERIFQADISELTGIEGLRRETADRIVNKEFQIDPWEELANVEKCGAKIVSFHDPSYPAALKEIHDPPILLYVKGKDLPKNVTFVGVVGSRNPSPYGSKSAQMIGQGLGRRGLGVVSGMAKGVDASAHWGCLASQGFTIAVLGTGIDIVYPAQNRKLADSIANKGALISEFPVGTPPEPKNFPIRNRVISGLSRGVIVVEATMKSGSLITAALALEQDREVFAVPGSIHSFKSTGCHFLIKQGARLIENSDDVLDELGMNYDYSPKSDTFQKEVLPPMDESEKVIYDMIGDYPLHIDQITRQGNLAPGKAASILMRMELKGMIRQLPGKVFVR